MYMKWLKGEGHEEVLHGSAYIYYDLGYRFNE